jgi:hypothetical protein
VDDHTEGIGYTDSVADTDSIAHTDSSAITIADDMTARSIAILLLAAFALLAVAPPTARAQTAPAALRLLLVAPLFDQVGMRDDLARYATRRLGELLAGQRFNVVPFQEGERAIRGMALKPFEPLTRANAVELGLRLRADGVVIGRVARVDVDGAGPPGSADEIPEGREAFVELDLTLVEVAGGRILLNVRPTGRGFGPFALRDASEQALRDFAGRVRAVLP